MAENSAPLIYREEGDIAFIEINRPHKKNALNNECWRQFDDHFEKLKANKKIRALVIRGRDENILSRQCIEGISAFLEKRSPKWST